MKTIGIDQSLCTRSSFEQKCMNNIKYINQDAGKCDHQQNLKNILDAAMAYNPQGVIDNSHNMTMASTPDKEPNAGKSLCLFTNILVVKHKLAKRRIVATK